MTTTLTPMPPITTTQLFSRRALGHLWDRRAELDPGQVALLQTIFNNKKKGSIDCSQTVTYKLSNKKAGKLGWGRYYGTKGSLEQLEKEIRGTMCRDYYHDIDIVNCHFILLTQFARRIYNVDLPEVDRYIANREQFLAEMGGNRDDAKTEVIKVLYGGQSTYPALLPMATETRKFSKMLSTKPEFAELFESCKGEKNVYGSFLSFILQTEERGCMLAMKASLERLGWIVDVLAYDGVMVRDDEGRKPIHTLEILNRDLKIVMDDIKKTENYVVDLVVKEFSYFDVPETAEQIVDGVSKDSYNEMKVVFEANNFYYMPSNEMVEVCGREMVRMTMEHAREYYSAKWRFTRSDKFGDYAAFFDLWRKDDTRRIIRSIDMKPSSDPSVFVMTPTFAWRDEAEASPTAVSKFQELIALFGGEPQQEYLTKWMAQMIQNPFETTGTGLVITGVKGCGKDTLFDFFMKFVIGTSYSTNYGCGGDQFFNTHDTGRMNKFLCKVEEANKDVFRKYASKFKSLITNDSEIFNGKNQKPVLVANYNRFVLTTNGGCPVEMNDGERRFVIARCSPAKKGDFAYWGDIRTALFNKEAGVAVGKWLSEMDLTSFNFRQIPKDDFQDAVVDATKTSEEFFVEQWDGKPASGSDLFTAYRFFCISENLPHALNTVSFGVRMLPLIRDGKINKGRSGEGVRYFR